MARTAPAARRNHHQARRTATAAALVTAVFLASACGEKDTPDDNGNTSSPTKSSPSPDAAGVEAEAAVFDAYQGMVTAKVEATSKGTLKGSDIGTYASEKALAGVKEEVFVNLQNDIVTTGKPKVEAERTTVDLKQKPHRAQLVVCFDNASLTPVNKSTGKSVEAPDQPKRYIVNASLRTIGERWVVTEALADRDRPC
ncbi:hypothetical protein LIX60_30695 [Streptomyces sp. S07_1.15]|uniref:hypothetical protein n=1 Tax=Streptomyces sp. S07_1.15 TaxID=2873925 RepID=UPI001D15D699|nr:hypothetical protein [Streptomyces sp. S07_1.15]MCC3655751.1 hypothetical protein [Streptomyces sp. S07_1.15]